MVERTFNNLFWVTSPILSMSLLFTGSATAVEAIPNQVTPEQTKFTESQAASSSDIINYKQGAEEEEMTQVTSVSQLSDVKPTDWAFQALQSLVERYGCIVGYPDRTYRGNRALSRYEFAAGLNACLDRINELIAAGTADLVKKEDLVALQKLQEEFAAELATIRGRVDALEARTATLERQQFSTTTKLVGEAIFSLADTFGDRAIRAGNGTFLSGVNAGNAGRLEDDQTETIFSNRVRLGLISSFTGRDRLWLRLNANNTTNFAGNFTGTNMTRLVYDGPTDPANSVIVDRLWYVFPIGDKLRIQVSAVQNEYFDSLISLTNPLQSSGQGTISRYGRANPLVHRNNNPNSTASAGVNFDFKLSEQFSIQGSYIGDRDSNNPSQKNGLFNGQNNLLGQIVFRPSQASEIGLSYSRSYYPGNEVNLTGSTGSAFATSPFGNNATVTDSFGAQAFWRLTPKITLGGWFGYAFARGQSGAADDLEAKIMNWNAYLVFPDLGKKGNQGAVIVGMPPKVVDNEFRSAANQPRRLDRDTSLHVEALYRYRINDNISITPGLIVIFNPEHQNDNDTQYVGVIRTTFSF